MSATVVSCLYGSRGFERFISQWDYAVAHLDPKPDTVIVTTDRARDIPHAHVYVIPECKWAHPQAFYLQQAITLAATEWVWIVDIDDLPLADGLAGIETVAADVWQMGWVSSEGETHLPPRLTPAEYLACSGNPYSGASAIRTEAFHSVGGFPDIAFQDWGLWRRMALHGMTVEPSTRAHYRYCRHPETRSAVELTAEKRAYHLAEMVEREPVVA